LWEAAKAGNLKAVPGLGFCHLGLWQMDASKTWLFHDPVATTETETSEIKQKMVCKKNSRTPRNEIIHDSIVTWISSP
jgi:hypothetical protein